MTPSLLRDQPALVAAGADVDARFAGSHSETPLHWAASSDDVEALDALLDAGADIEADGADFAGGTPIADAVAFGQWKAARRLLERGARTNLWQAAALGLLFRTRELLAQTPPSQDDLDDALWCAGHGGRRETAELGSVMTTSPHRKRLNAANMKSWPPGSEGNGRCER